MADQPDIWKQCLNYAAHTDVGMRRSNNQDSHTVVLASDAGNWYARGHVFVVADGMGAHAAGELASKLACDGVPHLYHKYHDKSPPEAMQKAILETNSEVHRRGKANADFHNMGTTLSTLVLLPQGALVAHIGDSRIYRLRGDTLRQLTFDHSLVWEMQAKGELPDGVDAAGVVPKNVITRSLGPNAHVKIDFEGPFPIQVGDTFLLCSDGLTGKVEDDELGSILANLPPQEAAEVLVDLANLRGGPDNITVIIVKVTGHELTTNASGAEPLVLGSKPEGNQSAHPAVWIIGGVCFLTALVMMIMGSAIPALAAAVGGVFALTFGLLQQFGTLEFGGPKQTVLAGGKVLGAGPHTSTKIASGEEFLQKLAAITKQLRNAGQRASWGVNWDSYNHYTQQAQAAASDDQAKSVRLYAGAIRELMASLREAKQRESSDSSVDLV